MVYERELTTVSTYLLTPGFIRDILTILLQRSMDVFNPVSNLSPHYFYNQIPCITFRKLIELLHGLCERLEHHLFWLYLWIYDCFTYQHGRWSHSGRPRTNDDLVTDLFSEVTLPTSLPATKSDTESQCSEYKK